MNRNKVGSSSKALDHGTSGVSSNGYTTTAKSGRLGFRFDDYDKKQRAALDDDNAFIKDKNHKKRQSIGKKSTPTSMSVSVMPQYIPNDDDDFQQDHKRKGTGICVETSAVERFCNNGTPPPPRATTTSFPSMASRHKIGHNQKPPQHSDQSTKNNKKHATSSKSFSSDRLEMEQQKRPFRHQKDDYLSLLTGTKEALSPARYSPTDSRKQQPSYVDQKGDILDLYTRTSRPSKVNKPNRQSQQYDDDIDDDTPDLFAITGTKLPSRLPVKERHQKRRHLPMTPSVGENSNPLTPNRQAQKDTTVTDDPPLSRKPDAFFTPLLPLNHSIPKLNNPKNHNGSEKLVVPKKHATHWDDDDDYITNWNFLPTTDNGSTNKTENPLHLPAKKRQINLGTNDTSKKTRLHLPEKQKAKKMGVLSDLPSQAVSAPNMDNEDLVECPYCLTVLDLNQSNAVALAYSEIQYKEKQFQEEQKTTMEDDDLPAANYRKRPLQRPVAHMDQFAFCQLHNIELVVKPQGNESNWPSVIIFENLLDRIVGFKHELDMVIAKKLDSSYRTLALEAYRDLGRHKARSTMGMMTRFETILPGYYGTKGAAIIQEHLAALYLHQGKLCRDVVAPQTPMEYLQQVLIPEVGFRLIREDLLDGDRSKQYDPNIDDQAKRIMAESAAYGSSLHPVDWNDAHSADDGDDVISIDDFHGGIDDDHSGYSGTGDQGGELNSDHGEKNDLAVTTQYIMDDSSEDEDDNLFDQASIPTKKLEFYDLCDD